MNESTIRSVRDKKCNIRSSGKLLGPHAKTAKITRKHEKLEELLYIWMQDMIHKKVALSLAAIQEEARIIFEYLQEKSEIKADQEFKGSKGWFDRFKSTYSLHNVTFSGEAASADEVAARDFK